jgi:hypothetical protein
MVEGALALGELGFERALFGFPVLLLLSLFLQPRLLGYDPVHVALVDVSIGLSLKVVRLPRRELGTEKTLLELFLFSQEIKLLSNELLLLAPLHIKSVEHLPLVLGVALGERCLGDRLHISSGGESRLQSQGRLRSIGLHVRVRLGVRTARVEAPEGSNSLLLSFFRKPLGVLVEEGLEGEELRLRASRE